MKYTIYLCRRCGGVCAGREGSLTFKCAYCGAVNQTKKSRKLATGIDSSEVSEKVGSLKMALAGKKTLD
jgi:phage FluMu protein Com